MTSTHTTTATTKHIPLVKYRKTTTTVEVSFGGQKVSDAGWSTTDGFVVHRTHDAYQGCPVYWLRIRDGHFSTHNTLADARAAIAHIRKRRG